MGLLEGEYHIRLDPQAELVQHAPRRVPVALRDRRKKPWMTVLVQQEVLAPVTRPTARVNSMVVVPKKDRKSIYASIRKA